MNKKYENQRLFTTIPKPALRAFLKRTKGLSVPEYMRNLVLEDLAKTDREFKKLLKELR